MDIKIENGEYPLRKNCFIRDGELSLCGWYGLMYLELTQRDATYDYTRLIYLNRQEFNTLYDMMTEMKKQMED